MSLESIQYLGVGHRSQDIHIAADGTRSSPEDGGASVFTALTASRLSGKRTAAVTSSSVFGTASQRMGVGDDRLEIYSDPNSTQTVFEDRVDRDARYQRLVSRAPAIKRSLGALGQRGRDAATVFACPLLDELPLDCRDWFRSDFACLIPQGWFRSVSTDGEITLFDPYTTAITGPWDLIVLSEDEAETTEDLADWEGLTGLLAVTKGSKGATVFSEGRQHEITALKPPALVDTTGAGDVWSAAFTVRYQETQDIEQAGRFAAAAAAICVSRPGLKGVPGSRTEVERLLRAQ